MSRCRDPETKCLNMESNRRKRTLEMVVSSFTDDLWIEIFLRLPFKSLLRFKSVSKTWFSIISSHRFAISHLAANAKNDEIFLIQRGYSNYEEDDGSFSLFHLDSWRFLKNLKFPYSQGEYPFDPILCKLIGSELGIVCVYVYVNYWPAAKKKYDIYLWNPATKQSKLIPPYTIPIDDYRTSETFGFGFDHIDLDFKVVRVVSSTLSAQVYSSNNNTWRMIDSKPVIFPHCFHVFRGFLFSVRCESGMMAFNLNKEVFIFDMKFPFSSFDDDGGEIQTFLSDFKDTIAVIVSILNKGKINLWTLDNVACVCSDGVEASWTKVISVEVGMPLDNVEGIFNNVQFLVLEREGDLFLYNWKENVTTEVPSRLYLESNIFKYTKSLFSLVGFQRIKWAPSSPRLQESSDWDE